MSVKNPRQPSSFEKLVRIAVAIAMVGAIAAAVALPVSAKDSSAVTRFLGRFHILALHVPIGILALTLTAEAATFFRRGRRMADAVVGFALPLLVLTGFAAVVLGLMLAHGGHYPHKLVAPHRNFTIIGIFIAGVARLLWSKRRSRWLHRGLLAASAGAMTIGAHFGGSMTHGEDYLFAPVSEKPSNIVDESDAGATMFEDTDAGQAFVVVPVDAGVDAMAAVTSDAGPVVSAPVDAGPPKPTSKQLAQAVVNRKCAPCHTTNMKGGLKMTDISKPTKARVLKPGNPEGSTMYTNLLLPKDDDDHMPPEDEAQLTKGEIAIIRQFIADQGK